MPPWVHYSIHPFILSKVSTCLWLSVCSSANGHAECQPQRLVWRIKRKIHISSFHRPCNRERATITSPFLLRFLLVASMKTFAIVGPKRGLQSYLLRDIKWLRRTWLFTMRPITEPGPGHRGSFPRSYAWWTSPPSSPIDRRESLPRPVRARLTSQFWPHAVPAVAGFPHRRGGWPGLESILKAIGRLLPSKETVRLNCIHTGL